MDPRYKPMIMRFLYMNFMIGFVYFGTLFILPETLSEANPDEAVEMYFYIICSELIAIVTSIVLIDIECLGRIHSIFLCMFNTSVFLCICTFVYPDSSAWVWSIALSRIFLSTFMAIFQVFSLEFFPTNIRATALGFTRISGTVAGLLTPFVSYSLSSIALNAPYALYWILCTVATIVIFYTPGETMNTAIKQ